MARDGVQVSPEFAALVVRYVQGERFNVRAQCTLLGCSKTAFYKYVARFAEHGVDGFYPVSRRPKSSPQRIGGEVEDLVVTARKQLDDQGWDAGADSIYFQLVAWRDGIASGPDPARGTGCEDDLGVGGELCGLLPPMGWPRGVKVPARATINRVLDRRGQLISVPQRRPRASTRRFEADQPNTR